MQFKALRIIYFMVALVGAAITGVHHFIGLLQDCKGKALIVCVWPVGFSTATETKGTSSKDVPSQGAHSKGKPAPEAGPQQTRELEAMLMWTGHVDGEVGRIRQGDFDKAVRRFQASLGAEGVGGKLSDSQRKALETRSRNARSHWQFRKVQDPQAAELWLPTKLLPTSNSLKYGRRYEADGDDFSVDVAQLNASDGGLGLLKDRHARGPSGARKLEGPVIERLDGTVIGFELSAIEGNERISVRAFQKDNLIRLLAITYSLERDKEYRILRNAIGSSYVPFGVQVKESRSASCEAGGADRDDCSDKPSRNAWNRIVGDQ
jgi:hypothetical protein